MNQGVAGKLTVYEEPQVSLLVLDYNRPAAAYACLESIRKHVKLDRYKVIYCHNGIPTKPSHYPMDLLHAGLIDELIMPRVNGGLGLGTRALYAACFSPLALSWQVDQVMGRDLIQAEVDEWVTLLSPRSRVDGSTIVASISLAGPVCGHNIFSERASVVETAFYRELEHGLPLSPGGAGPWHHLLWREGQIQQHYAERGYRHITNWPPLAIDNGRDAVRQNPDGSRWMHYPDTKQLWLLSGPVRESYVYPRFTEAEWASVLDRQVWPDGQIPETEQKESFHVWH